MDDLQFHGNGFAHAPHFHQALRACAQDFGKAAKVGEKGFRQGLRVATPDGAEQNHFEQFIIRHCIRSASGEACPQSFTMAG